MIIATFGPSTAWVGKTITYDDGRFVLEDVGQITAQAVVEYDRQGHLGWAYDGLREWAYAAGRASRRAAPPRLRRPCSRCRSPRRRPGWYRLRHRRQPRRRRPTRSGRAPGGVRRRRTSRPPTAPPSPPVASRVTPAMAPDGSQAYARRSRAPAAGPPAPAAAGNGRRGWFVLGGIVILALLVGIVVAGGRLRDGLGVALTLVAIVVRRGAHRRGGQAGRPGALVPGALAAQTLLVTCGAVAAGCFVLAGLLWWMPHYEVVAPTDKRIALDDTPEIKVLVVNRGLLRRHLQRRVLGGRQASRTTSPSRSAAGDGRELTLSLPGGVERGAVLLSLGGASVEAQAVAPPAFAVAPLADRPVAGQAGRRRRPHHLGQEHRRHRRHVRRLAPRRRRGTLAQPVEIAPGQTKDVTYDLTADAPAPYQLALGDAASRLRHRQAGAPRQRLRGQAQRERRPRRT